MCKILTVGLAIKSVAKYTGKNTQWTALYTAQMWIISDFWISKMAKSIKIQNGYTLLLTKFQKPI